MCPVLSTGGCWVHIQAKNFQSLKYPKTALKSCQKFITTKLNLSIGNNPHNDDIDFHIIGDIARVSRMPGSYDTNRKIYAQSIKRNQLTTIKDLQQLAKKQNNKIYWYGDDKIDISKFDSEPINCNIDIPEYDYDYDKLDIMKNIPPCIIDILTNKDNKGDWRGRWMTTLYFKEKGYPKSMINKIAEQFFKPVVRYDALKNNYNHWVKVNCMNLVYGNEELIFPNCAKIYEEGYCHGKCKHYETIYK